jgi:hypothetical protein
MDKGLLFFIIIGAGLSFLLINFINGLQDEVNHHEKSQKPNPYEQYQSIDSIGESIIDVTGADTKTQLAAWNASPLKVDFLNHFPNFYMMKEFAQERVSGDILQSKLIKKIDEVENKFIGGELSGEEAKKSLSSLQ